MGTSTQPASGDLRQRITIRRNARVSDGKGGFTPTWSTIANRISARVRSLNGREAVIGQVLQGVSVFEIIIRYRADIKTSDQILFEGRELNIHSAEDRDGLRNWTHINASSEAAQGA